MKKIRLRIANNVDITKLFSASIRCGSTYNYELTLETHSNNTFPTIRAIPSFVVIVEPICESKRTIEYKMMPNGDIRAFQAQAKDKRGANGESIYDPKNIAPTILVDGKINIILYEKD